MSSSNYINTDHLTGTMTEFGRYRLTYEPPSDAIETEITLSISSEADLPQMMDLFGDFLRATGYLSSDETLEFSWDEFDDPLTPV